MTWINQNSFNGALPAWMSGSNEETPFGAPPSYSPPMTGGSPGDAYRPTWWGSGSGAGSGSGSGASSDPFGAGFGSYNPFGGLGLPTGSFFSQFMNSAQQFIGRYFGGGSSNGPAAAEGPGVALQDGQISSTGDPHIAVTGTTCGPNGTTTSVNSHFDSMSGHADLFSTKDFGDGFNVSTAVTQPNASGVTYNQSATATMNGGLDSVQMSLGGGLQVVSGGSAVSLQPGQTASLSGGEQVSENANGSVTIDEQNASGGTLATTFTNTGAGIDVTAQAHDVHLHGDAVTGGSTPAATSPSASRWT